MSTPTEEQSITCPDCGHLPEVDEDRHVCVNVECRRYLIGVIIGHFTDPLSDEEIERARREFMENDL